ncbi:hypothetical protein T484DRAFT_1756037 [Baffinella frigidus]|nr:hypothetical protein T484DRAFT_1756037 [Cryptophyta sp. CCMP2293]
MTDTIAQLSTTDAHYAIVKRISDLKLSNAHRRQLEKHINTYCSDILAGNKALIQCITYLGHSYTIERMHKKACDVKVEYYKQCDAMRRTNKENVPLDMCLALCKALEPRLGEHSHVKVLDPEVLRMVCAFAGLRNASYLNTPKMLD